jgi:hypothetical protein
LIDFLKPTKYTPWFEDDLKKVALQQKGVLQKGALQKKGVRQFKQFHLQQDEGNLQDEVVLPFKNIQMTDYHQLLPNQVTKRK